MEIVKNQISARMKKLCTSFIYLHPFTKTTMAPSNHSPETFLAIIVQQNDI